MLKVGIDIGARKVSLQTGVDSGVSTTTNINPDDALIIAEVMKQSALTIQRDDQRRLNEEREKAD